MSRPAPTRVLHQSDIEQELRSRRPGADRPRIHKGVDPFTRSAIALAALRNRTDRRTERVQIIGLLQDGEPRLRDKSGGACKARGKENRNVRPTPAQLLGQATPSSFPGIITSLKTKTKHPRSSVRAASALAACSQRWSVASSIPMPVSGCEHQDRR